MKKKIIEEAKKINTITVLARMDRYEKRETVRSDAHGTERGPKRIKNAVSKFLGQRGPIGTLTDSPCDQAIVRCRPALPPDGDDMNRNGKRKEAEIKFLEIDRGGDERKRILRYKG
ncbi:hypothetical protein SLEP1_g6891 [Rubroshorea leprosula]|uniref:Uncharacterized protein n=1 Tax=Rubroshorea leprosula TaxID=152421 RepID=A0AAV5I4X9_9ROSI|nr:hypothetical protein SLEP1_g6891 [Rubroshorea leprosula]